MVSLTTPLPHVGTGIIAAAMVGPDDSDGEQPLTHLLRRAASGEVSAADAALPLVYRELRELARRRMAGERRDHTLQATALVNETWIKLVAMGNVEWSDRTAFYQAAATAMRRILVDHARRRNRIKRGGGAGREPVSVSELASRQPDLGDAETFLQLDQAIEQLERQDARAGAVVRLRFFAGLDIDETAAALQLSRRTVLREWAFARAQLFAAMSGVAGDA